MTTETPLKSPEENEHLEPQPTPRFPINKNPGGGVMDDQNRPSGDASDPRGPGPDKVVAPKDLESAESSASRPLTGTIGAEEKGLMGKAGQIGKGFNSVDSALPPQAKAIAALASLFTTNRRKKAAAGGVIGGAVVLGFLFFAVIQGPLEFIHLAQNLQKNFKSNEDFGNDRTSKILIYALSGRGAQNGRLGITGNYSANRWEKRLLRETGMRPVYADGSRRFVGFEIVDENKAQRVLGDISEKDGRGAKNIERAMGNGAEISDGNERVRNASDESMKNRRFIDLSKVNFADRRAFIRTIGSATSVTNISSSIASRVLIKRAGVEFHPLNKVKQLSDEQIAKFLEKRTKNIEEGSQSTDDIKPDDSDKNNDEKPDIDPTDQDSADKSKSYIDEFKKSGVFKSGTSAAVVVGVLCATKSYGESVPEYKYQNVYLPQVRTGLHSIATGNQVMSNDDFNLNSLKVMTRYLRDKEKGTSYSQAAGYRALNDKEGGIPPPKEASLKDVGDKPAFFNFIDGIPLLGDVCSIQEGIFGLPVIKNVSGALSEASQAVINVFLSQAGTSTDELMESSLKVVAGKTINPEAKGADFGNFAATGSFLAANEQAISSGGRALDEGERQNLATYEKGIEKQDYTHKSFFAKTFDLYDSRSILGSTISSIPNDATTAISSLSGTFSTIFSKSFIINFLPKTQAATSYDYGVPKYGFSLAERRDDLYENPYENGQRDRSDDGQRALPKLEDDLPRLNEKYGKKCFGTTVTFDANNPKDGIHIQTDKINIFKVAKDNKDLCDPKKNRDDRLNQYRMYIADAMTAASLACYEGDNDYCVQLGFSAEDPPSGDQGTAQSISGDAQELAKIIISSGKVSGDSRYMEQINKVASGDGSCKINPTILKIIVAAINKNYSLYISSLNRKCTGVLTASGEASYHYSNGGGHAVDFSIINGSGTTGRDANARKLLNDLAGVLPKGSGVGQVGCGPSVSLPEGVSQFADSCNHLHIQVPKE